MLLIMLCMLNFMPVSATSLSKDVDYGKLPMSTLKAKANNGDIKAQYVCGLRYLEGNGVQKNEAKAIEFLKKSATNNYPDAYGELGFIFMYNKNNEESLYSFRKGASLNDGKSYYGLYLHYMDNAENKEVAGEMLKRAANLRFGHAFFILALAYRHGGDGLPKDRESAIYWGKKDCDKSYAEYLESGEMPREGDGWPYLIKWLKELGCDYDPALHVEEFKTWMAAKPTSSSSRTSTQTSVNSNSNISASVKYHYTKSGKGQSQNTGQWTDAMAPEECEVEFFDGYITVNGGIHQFVKESGSWKVYGGQSMGWGGNNTTFYYYVDANKNMKQVCESSFPYGFDTFIYPMSMNGDPTPQNNSSSTSYNNTTRGSSNSNSPRTQTSSKFKCAYCNGTGRIERNDNAPASFGTDRPRQRCNECGKWYDPNVVTHYHQQCRHCGGTGYAK